MTEVAVDPSPPPSARGGLRGWRGTALCGLVYLALAVVLWWGVWSTHPTTVTTCGCGDAARFLWFFEWPAYAVTHGHSVLSSQWLFHPTGINLLDDTSVLALGITLIPVTLALGPVAAMNVALTLAPALSALAMFALLRRWVAWSPAAFVGGLVYGFSPFVITVLALNQLNIAFLAILPLIIMAVDDLLVRQRRSPYRTGAILAFFLAVQFFVSTELLLITVLFVLLAGALMVGFVAFGHSEEIAVRAGYALRGTATAAAGTVILLAYPLWFLLHGPAHLTGPIWSISSISHFGNSLTSFWTVGSLGRIGTAMVRLGGYQGPMLPGLGYLGMGVVVVAVAGVVLWRHDRRLLLFGALAVIAAVLSLAPGQGYWVPWQWAEKIPWVGNIVEARFTAVVALCLAVMVAVVVDRSRTWLVSHQVAALGLPGGVLATVIASVLVIVMLVPTAVAMWPNVPLTVRAVVLPRWYVEVGAHLPPGDVVLAYPAPFSTLQSSQAWQAVNRMAWAQAGGGGPQGQLIGPGRPEPGFEVLFGASFPLVPAPVPNRSTLAAVRQALRLWEVTTVVVPDQPGLPPYEQGRSAAYAVGLFTAALGRPPVYQHAAWVWAGVSHMGAPVPMTAAAFGACVRTVDGFPSSSAAVSHCILGTGG